MEVNMQGKRPLYLLLSVLILLNLVATNLQAREVQSAYKAHLENGLPIAFEFSSSH